MALTPSTMLPLGTMAPDFHLPDTNGKMVSPADFKDAAALLVIFMCNHCPYVIHIREGLKIPVDGAAVCFRQNFVPGLFG